MSGLRLHGGAYPRPLTTGRILIRVLLLIVVAVALLSGWVYGVDRVHDADGGYLRIASGSRVGVGAVHGPDRMTFGQLSPCIAGPWPVTIRSVRPARMDSGVEFLGARARLRDVRGANKMLGALYGFPPMQDGRPFFDDLQPVEGFVVTRRCRDDDPTMIPDIVIGLHRVDGRGGTLDGVLVDYQIGLRWYTAKVKGFSVSWCGSDAVEYCYQAGS